MNQPLQNLHVCCTQLREQSHASNIHIVCVADVAAGLQSGRIRAIVLGSAAHKQHFFDELARHHPPAATGKLLFRSSNKRVSGVLCACCQGTTRGGGCGLQQFMSCCHAEQLMSCWATAQQAAQSVASCRASLDHAGVACVTFWGTVADRSWQSAWLYQ